MHPYYVYSRQFQSLTVNSIEDRTNWFYKKKIKWDAIFEPNWAGKPPKPEHHIDMGRLVRWELTVRYNSWKAGSISSRTAYPSCDEGTDRTESWRVPARDAHRRSSQFFMDKKELSRETRSEGNHQPWLWIARARHAAPASLWGRRRPPPQSPLRSTHTAVTSRI